MGHSPYSRTVFAHIRCDKVAARDRQQDSSGSGYAFWESYRRVRANYGYFYIPLFLLIFQKDLTSGHSYDFS